MKSPNFPIISIWKRTFSILLLGLLLGACGGGATNTGAPVEALPDQTINDSTDETTTPFVEYQRADGPQPESDDVRAYMMEVWNNLARQDRCGSCHGDGTDPTFARLDDINLAYNAVLPFINKDTPQSSTLVTKVSAGHNCWLGTANADSCGSIIERWITNWVLETDGDLANLIIIEPPPDRPLDTVKVFSSVPPLGFSLGTDNLYSQLREYCSDCHSEAAATPQSPYIASDNIDNAWEAVKTKIDVGDEDRELNDALSRLVVRLRSEFHNCWSDCQQNAQSLLTAIQTIAGEIVPTKIDKDLQISHGIQLRDGTIATTGGRYESKVIALWDFHEGEGYVAHDVSGVEPAMDLYLYGDTAWVEGNGISLRNGRAQAESEPSKKLYDKILQTGEYSIEAWVTPANVTQENAWIVSYSGNNQLRNFTLSQTLYNYDFFQRTSTSTENGEPALSTADADQRLQATLQHVIVTYDPAVGRKIYVDGVYTGDLDDETTPGNLGNWDDSFALIVGNEASGQRQWQGDLRFLAIHNQALTPDQVATNFDAGVGQKYFLSFQITDLVEIDDCWDSYIVFEVSEFDSYSYLFNKPFFARLYSPAADDDPDASARCKFPTPPKEQSYSFDVSDIRIGINGKVVEVGQAYRYLSANIRSALNDGEYQSLGGRGTVIAKANGPQDDIFFLAFGSINGKEGVFSEPGVVVPEDELSFFTDRTQGLKTFAEINASMATLTGIPITNEAVQSTYNSIIQQLPGVETLNTFVPAHQVAIAQLAIEYCNELVELEKTQADDERTFFKGFNLLEDPATAFDTAEKRALVYDPVINILVGTDYSVQPTTTQIKRDFDTLLDGYNDPDSAQGSTSGLLDCPDGCPTDRTATIVKSVCAAALGSATTLIQ